MLTVLLPPHIGVIVKTCLFIIQICNGIMRFAIIYKLLCMFVCCFEEWNEITKRPTFILQSQLNNERVHSLPDFASFNTVFNKWALHMMWNNKKTVDSSEWIMKYLTESSPLCLVRKSKEREWGLLRHFFHLFSSNGSFNVAKHRPNIAAIRLSMACCVSVYFSYIMQKVNQFLFPLVF